MLEMPRIDEILKFWFGRVEETIVPSEHRARIWFGDDPEADAEVKMLFTEDLEKAIQGLYNHWEQSARGQLALILLLDQFSRHIFRNTPKAYQQDEQALMVCLKGIKNGSDHHLSLIERVFYYFPLLHSEQIRYQEQAIHAYEILVQLAFAETRIIYDSFLKFANHHYTIVQRFGRFPQRNHILNRPSTEEEMIYLKELESYLE